MKNFTAHEVLDLHRGGLIDRTEARQLLGFTKENTKKMREEATQELLNAALRHGELEKKYLAGVIACSEPVALPIVGRPSHVHDTVRPNEPLEVQEVDRLTNELIVQSGQTGQCFRVSADKLNHFRKV